MDLHHVDPENYDDLDPSKFFLLDTRCHEFVEWMAIRVASGHGKGKSPVPNEEVMLAWVGNYLPKIVRHYGFSDPPKRFSNR